MGHRNSLFVLGLAVLLSIPGAVTWGQTRGGLGAARGGTRGGISPRSGLGFRSNPIANPAPSLTPNQVLNPRGSLSTGQVLNPSPSLHQPRSGGTPPATKDGGMPRAVTYQSARPAIADDAAVGSVIPVPIAIPAGEKILFAVVALDQQIDKVAPDKGWSKRLSLDELRGVPAFSLLPKDDSQRTALEKILKTYQGVAKDDSAANISKLPEFKQTLDALQNYLTPIDVRRREQAALSFRQLASDLKSFKNGASWVKHLVPAELTTTDSKISASKEQTEKLLKRFNKLAGNPDYQKVTSLPGFSPAYAALKAIVDQTKP